MVHRHAGVAIGRIERVGSRIQVLPYIAGLGRDGHADSTEFVAHRNAAAAGRGKAGVAGDVLGDKKGIGLGIAQAPRHIPGAFGKTERHGGLWIQPGNRRAGHQPGLAGVIGADPDRLHSEALREIMAPGKGHGDTDRAGGRLSDSNVALHGMGQRRALLSLSQRRGEVEHIGSVVSVEDHRTERLALERIAGNRRQGTVRIGADRSRAAGKVGLSDGLERRRDVQPAAAIDRVGPLRAEVVGRAEQDVDNL